MPAVEILRRAWVQNYVPTKTAVRWRTPEDGLPEAGLFISSPWDLEAHLAKKHTTCCVRCKVHLTETCEDDLPNLVTHVETTSEPTADGGDPRVHGAQEAEDLLPRVNPVNTGFLEPSSCWPADTTSGWSCWEPTRRDPRWRVRDAQGFGVERFPMDWERRHPICPEGHVSSEWSPRIDLRGNECVYIRLKPSDCGPCPSCSQCTRSRAKYPRRSIAARP